MVFTIDPTKDPKQITVKSAPDSTFTIEGIYRFDGDKLIICMPMYDVPKARPTKFELDPADPARAIMTFVREGTPRPSPPQAVAPFDAAKAKELQTAWAKHLGVEPEITNGTGMKLRLIPPGEFMMGSSAEEIASLLKDPEVKDRGWAPGDIRTEGPLHQVKIRETFYLGSQEVTVGQFRQFVSATQYQTDAEKNGGGLSWTGKVDIWETRKENVWNNAEQLGSEAFIRSSSSRSRMRKHSVRGLPRRTAGST